MASKARSGWRSSGWVAVVLLSMVSLAAALLLSRPLQALEIASADVLMRFRYAVLVWSGNLKGAACSDVSMLAIDSRTQEELGRFGAGTWVCREPFLHQIAFFEQYFRPTVMAYDILFQDTRGSRARQGQRVSESPDRLRRMGSQIARVAENPNDVVSSFILPELNRFSMEQGNSILANTLASVREKGCFETILGCFFMGGHVDPQYGVPLWSNADVFGDDPDGNENHGERIPYVRDLAIPADDVHFAEPDRLRDYWCSPNASLPSLELLDYSSLGFLNGPRDPDGVVRRLPMVIGFRHFNSITKKESVAFVPSFSLVSCLLHLGVSFPLSPGVVQVHMGKEIVVNTPRHGMYRIPIDDEGFLYLNYQVKLTDFDSVSFLDFARGPSAPPEARDRLAAGARRWIDGRIVVVAVSATGLDVGNCPLSPNVPLVYTHLTAIQNILGQSFIAPLARRGQIILTAILFVLFTTVCALEKSARLGPASVLFLVLYMLAAYAGVHFNVCIMPLVIPVVYIAFCAFSLISYRFFVEERARRKIRGMFSTMVSGKVLAFLEENPDSFSLKGHNVETTVFFSDVAGFTRISETLPPERLTQLLNLYLTPVTDCILEHGGYLDKYVGDGVMAVWGAPFPDPDHALKACLSALEQQRIIREMNPRLRTEFGQELRVRMGISSGMVTAGNMGSERKFQFTVMGDTVNLASRLEPVNKDFETGIIVSEATHQRIRHALVTRALGRIVVVGKKEVVDIYEVVGEQGKVPAGLLDSIGRYELALARFYDRDWAVCLDALESILAAGHDGPAAHLRKLALEFRAAPPDAAWKGEYVREQKT